MNPWKVHVLKFASRQASTSYLVLRDTHTDPNMEVSYYMWALTNGNPDETVIVDVGFTEKLARERGRDWICSPAQRLEQLGIDAKKVKRVIVSHLHWDHCGGYDLFPNATFYVQEKEMAFWTGKYVKYKTFGEPIHVEDIVTYVRLNYDGRIQFTNGTDDVLPGLRVHRVGGHTAGIQVTEVATASGTAVVASDATHTYWNLKNRMPTQIVHDVPGYLDGFELMSKLAKSWQYVLPGHDPEVFKIHKEVSEGIVVVE